MADPVTRPKAEAEKEQELEAQGSDGTEDLSEWVASPGDVKVWLDEFHVLHVNARGKTFDNVRPRRAFPLSGKADYVSFLNEKDKEVVLLAEPGKLDPKSRAALEKALERVYYVAKIRRVDSISETMGVSLWQVMTDKGYASFEVVERNSIRSLPDGRLIIIDVDGNRFEVESLGDLDERSQALIYNES